jgi:membrane protease YdiL (CAAX protease family)
VLLASAWVPFPTFLERMNHCGKSNQPRKSWLAIECAALFAGVPAVYAIVRPPIPVIVLLIVMAGGCWLSLRHRQRIEPCDLIRWKVPKAEWQRVLATWAIALPLLACLLWFLKPDALFSLLTQNPKAWAFVMLAYPLVSVFPQEFVYRVFFFDRYRPLFGSGVGMVFASAVMFSFGHVVFHNFPAVGLTFLGGWLFARTYQRSASLPLVAIEHALYGCAVFTIGLGEFLLDGTMRLFR